MYKKLRNSLLAFLTMFSILAASTDSIPPKPPKEKDPDLPPIVIGGRSSTCPSNVTANLCGDELTIVFEQSEGLVWVEVSDASYEQVYIGTHDSTAPIIIPIDEASTPLLIYISTEYGTEYEGWIQ